MVRKSNNELFNLNYFKRHSRELVKLINSSFKNKQSSINELFDSQAQLEDQYRGAFFVEVKEKPFSLLFTAFHKNLVNLYAAIELTKRGLYGPARALLRHCFEYLMLAKYCQLKGTPRQEFGCKFSRAS